MEMETLVLLKYIQNGECLLKFPSYVSDGLNCLTNLIFKRTTYFIGKVRLKVEKWDYFRKYYLGAGKKCNPKVYERFWVLTSVTDPDPDPH
jgi:hypothetical protein